MKRLFLLCMLLCSTLVAAQMPQPPMVAARAWLLYDYSAGKILAAEGADQRIDPASLTKLMTAYVVFAALKNRSIALEQPVQVSEQAWKAEGSRMFIEPQRPVTVDELIHGMIIQSGNDACIALAEAVAGSSESFVGMMNREARRLGLTGTQFRNPTGLTEPGHYTTPRDLALLASAILRDHPQFFPIYSKREYTYNRITQANRNRLLWLDPTVDGMKTGHTEAAGFNLVATGKRGPRRLISVVTGASSDAVRAQESQKLLNFGFLAFDTVRLYAANKVVRSFEVWKGAKPTVPVGFRHDLLVAVPRGQADRLTVDIESRQPLYAPIAAGSQVATLKLSLDGQPWGQYPVSALEEVPQAGLIGRTWDTIRLWFK